MLIFEDGQGQGPGDWTELAVCPMKGGIKKGIKYRLRRRSLSWNVSLCRAI
jgi:hypothetical protein